MGTAFNTQTYRIMVITLDFDSSYLGSSPSRSTMLKYVKVFGSYLKLFIYLHYESTSRTINNFATYGF